MTSPTTGTAPAAAGPAWGAGMPQPPAFGDAGTFGDTSSVLTPTVLESMTSGVVILDANWRVVLANSAAIRLLETSRDHLVGRTLDTLAGRQQLTDVSAHLRTLVREHIQHGRRRLDPDYLLTTGTGRTVPVELLTTPITEDRTVTGAVVVVRDITERKLAEQALGDGEERFRAIFNSAAIGMMRLDATGRINESNLALRAITGIGEQLSGMSVHELVADTHTERSRTLFRKLVAGGRDRYQIELPLRHADGHATWCQLTMSILRDRTGWPLYVIGAVLDISERRQLEAELARAVKLEAIGQMAAGIAHEINTPIQFIGDNVRFLSDCLATLIGLLEHYRRAVQGGPDALDADRLRQLEDQADLDFLAEQTPLAVDQTLDGVDRVATIVKAIKALGHHSENQQAPADVNQSMTDALTVARNEIKYVADIEVELGDLPAVVCSVGEISQVFLNLAVNAAHAIADKVGSTGGRGCIRVRSWHDHDDVVFEIGDTGAGIPEAIRHKIFDPFFTTKEVGRGSGHGLALAHAIVCDKHGGGLTFRTKPGVGTTFVVRLPVAGNPPAVGRPA